MEELDELEELVDDERMTEELVIVTNEDVEDWMLELVLEGVVDVERVDEGVGAENEELLLSVIALERVTLGDDDAALTLAELELETMELETVEIDTTLILAELELDNTEIELKTDDNVEVAAELYA